MAREILFKAKRIGDGKWVEGDLIKRAHYDEVTYYIGFIEMTSLSKAQAIPETVSQFTGLYDKNGKKIFEGDIIKLTINRSLIFSVNWVDDCGMFCLKCLSRHPRLNLEAFDTDFTTVDGDECEIIGNVFDNSDLLKGE